MQRFRSTWLALIGAVLLITLSVSAAAAAKPSGTAEGTRGQTVAAFVHDLVFGSQTDDDEEDTEGGDADQEENSDEDTDEDLDEEVSEEDEELVDEDSERQVPEEFANHGECVSDATHDTEGFEEAQQSEESEVENFGDWVSTHARYVCWGLEAPGDEEEEEASATEDDEDDSEASAKEQRAAERAAAKAEREAARAERHAAREAAKAARTQGNGRGGGRP